MTTATAEQASTILMPAGEQNKEQARYDEAFRQIVAAAVAREAYSPRHAAIEDEAPAAASKADVSAIAQQKPEYRGINDRVMRVTSDVHTALVWRRRMVADRWGALPRWQQRAYKIGSFLTTVTGLTLALQAYRVTGAAAVEVTMLTDSITIQPDAMPTIPGADLTAQDALDAASFAASLVAGLHMAAQNGDLPADLNKGPEPQALGKWNPETGGGTIWGQTVAYADKLGYGDLTERQKWMLTDAVLDANKLSWDEARELSPSYQPPLPSQKIMLASLDNLDAERTHTPDRAPAIDTGEDNHPDAGNHPPAHTHDAPGDNNDANSTPETLEDEKDQFVAWWDNPQKWLAVQWAELRNIDDELPAWLNRNWWRAAALGGILVVAKMAQNQRKYGAPFRPRKNPAWNAPTPATSPTPLHTGQAPANGTGESSINPPEPKQRNKILSLSNLTKATFIANAVAWYRRRQKQKKAKATAEG